MEIERFYKIGMPWLADKILHHSRMGEITTPEGVPWDFRLWMIWAARLGFVGLWPDPPTLGFVARPISMVQAERWEEYDPGELLYVYDMDGELIWFDFLWAPGQYNVIYEFLESTGKKWVGWQHRVTLAPHLKLISRLPSQVKHKRI